MPACWSAAASLAKRDSYIGVQGLCQPDVVFDTLQNILLGEMTTTHSELVESIKDGQPLLNRELFLSQVVLFKFPDFVVVPNHFGASMVVYPVQNTIKSEDNQRLLLVRRCSQNHPDDIFPIQESP